MLPPKKRAVRDVLGVGSKNLASKLGVIEMEFLKGISQLSCLEIFKDKTG